MLIYVYFCLSDAIRFAGVGVIDYGGELKVRRIIRTATGRPTCNIVLVISIIIPQLTTIMENQKIENEKCTDVRSICCAKNIECVSLFVISHSNCSM